MIARRLKTGPSRLERNLFRRRRTDTLVIAKPHAPICDRFVDAGWLKVSILGALCVVFSRKENAQEILRLVTDAPKLCAAEVICTHDTRWTIDHFVKDAEQLSGLSQYRNRPYRAAAMDPHLVCLADALLAHLRLERPGAQGQRTRETAAECSTAAQAQRGALL
jgi:hypothetical protein